MGCQDTESLEGRGHGGATTAMEPIRHLLQSQFANLMAENSIIATLS